MNIADAFIDHLVAQGWRCEPPRGGAVPHPHPEATGIVIPGEHRAFVQRFSMLASGDDSRWFLSASDYAGEGDSAFAWDELRSLGLDAAEDDADRARVEAFWTEHLPILLAVGGDYEYLAINRSSGVVVHGAEPDFEDATPVASGLTSLMRAVVNGTLRVPLLRS